MNWLLFSCIASAAIALTIGGVLIAFWLADRGSQYDKNMGPSIRYLEGFEPYEGTKAQRQRNHSTESPWGEIK